jgi:hypothetical protein
MQGSLMKSSRTKVENEDIIALELAHLGYNFNDSIDARLGRMRIPTFMFSDILNVSYYFDFISTNNVYSITPIKQYDGVEVSYNSEFYNQYATATLFYGKTKTELYDFKEPGKISKIDSGYGDIYGLVLKYEYENFSARSAYVKSYLIGDKNANIKEDDFYYMNLGMRYDFEQAYILGEYIKLDSKKSLPETSSWYIASGYNFGKWTPFVSYSKQHSVMKPIPLPVREGFPADGTPQKGLPTGFPTDGMPQEGLPIDGDQKKGLPAKFPIDSAKDVDITTKSIGLRYNLYENTAIKFQYDAIDDSKVFSASISFVF